MAPASISNGNGYDNEIGAEEEQLLVGRRIVSISDEEKVVIKIVGRVSAFRIGVLQRRLESGEDFFEPMSEEEPAKWEGVV